MDGMDSAKLIWDGNNLFKEMEFPVCSIGVAVEFPRFNINAFNGE